MFTTEIDFDQFRPAQADLEKQVKSIPTLWTVTPEELAQLDQAAQILLRQNPCVQQLLLDTGRSASFIDASFAAIGCPRAQPSTAPPVPQPGGRIAAIAAKVSSAPK